jgi:hypothetical protein
MRIEMILETSIKIRIAVDRTHGHVALKLYGKNAYHRIHLKVAPWNAE